MIKTITYDNYKTLQYLVTFNNKDKVKFKGRFTDFVINDIYIKVISKNDEFVDIAFDDELIDILFNLINQKKAIEIIKTLDDYKDFKECIDDEYKIAKLNNPNLEDLTDKDLDNAMSTYFYLGYLNMVKYSKKIKPIKILLNLLREYISLILDEDLSNDFKFYFNC